MTNYEIIIIGSGFSGICAAIQLQEKNIHNFVILERDEALGGTWWRNSYPGAAVDVPSGLYSFSFEPHAWSRLFAAQSEILAYTQNVIAKHKLEEKAKKNVQIKKLEYIEATGIWKVESNEGSFTAKYIISATGGLSQPAIPTIAGLENFKGKYFHTSRWDHTYDYQNKKIAVIGTGASAVQVVPELAKTAQKLHVLQRTPHWILPRPDRILNAFERSILSISAFQKLQRAFIYLKSESRVLFFSKFPSLAKVVRLEALRHIKKQVKDKKLKEILTPNFDIGCKRVLLTNDYYPALQKPNVNLELTGIEEIEETGIRLKNQEKLEVDLIVFATGFHAAENAVPFPIIGKNQLSIQEYWEDTAHAYLGITCPNFPNLFMMMGPNTGTGHTSVIYFIESQMNYVIDGIQKARANQWKSFEVKEPIENDYNIRLQEKLKKSIWQVGACKSWYVNSKGVNTTMYPEFSFIYRKNTKKFKETDYLIEK